MYSTSQKKLLSDDVSSPIKLLEKLIAITQQVGNGPSRSCPRTQYSVRISSVWRNSGSQFLVNQTGVYHKLSQLFASHCQKT